MVEVCCGVGDAGVRGGGGVTGEPVWREGTAGQLDKPRGPQPQPQQRPECEQRHAPQPAPHLPLWWGVGEGEVRARLRGVRCGAVRCGVAEQPVQRTSNYCVRCSAAAPLPLLHHAGRGGRGGAARDGATLPLTARAAVWVAMRAALVAWQV
ncbi:hypothetical protein E2C01_038904 [Portunus trituberculatus]|uniref:Uncharacterized protein n=1 Tax=Portunus trituberculatus TaxID=210409 RepID=A0A5B7FFE1_PORTR|nr:hypothetical protein [Portunus trituberculatus]